MRARDLLYETWQALSANKGRSILTIIGIVIGISAVIAMTALIGGIKNSLVGELGLNQSRMLYIYVNAPRAVTFDDLDQIKNGVSGYEFVTGAVNTSATISTGIKSGNAQITGVKPDYLTATGVKMLYGRSFSDTEEESGAMLAIVDQGTVKTLFGNSSMNVTGKTIKIGQDDYTIIGIVQSSSMMTGDSATIYLPYTTTCARLTGSSGGISSIVGYALEGEDIDSLTSRTSSYIKAYFGLTEDSSVDVMSMKSILDELNTTMSAFQLLMTAVASISLFVGGIGIMNMMLTNVSDRIREIGLRKALGAKSRYITRQFLLESVVLCLIGGAIGILLGYGLSFVLAAGVGAAQQGISITPAIDLQSVLLATGVCVAIGIVFGYYPARRAARLNPVEALRYQ